MNRIAITEHGFKIGNWFDLEKAECFNEDTWWNGNNHISRATGSQWEHEAIYITKGGVIILNHWSDYQGSVETYEIISKAEAANWFIRNEYTDSNLPSSFATEIDGLEIK